MMPGRLGNPVLLTSVAAVGLAVVTPLLGDYARYIVSLWLIYSLSAIGLNLVMGYGHLNSLGHGGFMLIGAYATGIAVSRLGWPPFAGLLLAVAASVPISVVVGLPAIRLRHFSLAIVSFAFATTLFHVVKSFAFTGGPQGLYLQVGAVQRALGGNLLFLVALALNVLAIAGCTSVVRAKTGLALRLIGVNEIVARSFGIDVVRGKLAAFALSGLVGAAAGSLHALTTGFVGPETYSADLSVAIFAAVMIGGKGRLLGPYLGAAFIVVVPELTQDSRGLGQIVYAILFIVAVTLFPNGLTGMIEAAIARRGPTGDARAAARP